MVGGLGVDCTFADKDQPRSIISSLAQKADVRSIRTGNFSIGIVMMRSPPPIVQAVVSGGVDQYRQETHERFIEATSKGCKEPVANLVEIDCSEPVNLFPQICAKYARICLRSTLYPGLRTTAVCPSRCYRPRENEAK